MEGEEGEAQIIDGQQANGWDRGGGNDALIVNRGMITWGLTESYIWGISCARFLA